MIQIPTPPQPGASEAERLAFDDACRVADLQLRDEALKQNAAAQAHRDRMAAATEANGAALRAVADKTDSLADQKRAAVIQLLSTQARGNRKPLTVPALTDAQMSECAWGYVADSRNLDAGVTGIIQATQLACAAAWGVTLAAQKGEKL